MCRTAVLFLSVSIAFYISGCSSPSPASYLQAAAAAVDIASTLPNLTPAEVAYLQDAASGISCASTVLDAMETPAEESLAIAKCFAALPLVPAPDQPYISAALSTVQLFIDLFSPPPSEKPVALKANAAARSLDATGRSRLAAYLSDVNSTAQGTMKRLRHRNDPVAR